MVPVSGDCAATVTATAIELAQRSRTNLWVKPGFFIRHGRNRVDGNQNTSLLIRLKPENARLLSGRKDLSRPGAALQNRLSAQGI